jgi:thiol-disulfide isomerase/thioredoxin
MIRIPGWTLLVLASATFAPALAATRPAGVVALGDVVGHRFSGPVLNANGIKSLEELRGRPVLIDFWGTRCPPCVGTAVPASLKLQDTYGDDLQVVFVESQAHAFDDVSAFALGQRWLGGRAMWTSEQPCVTGFTMLPGFVLLGNDGTVLLKGNPLSMTKEIERQIAEQVKLREAPPASAHPAVRAAWTEFVKGHYARAFELSRAATQSAKDDGAVLQAIRETESTFRTRMEARFVRVQWAIDNAQFERASEELDGLKRCVQGAPELEARVLELVRRLESSDLAAERDAAKQLSRLSARFYESGGDAAVALELEHLAQKNPNTKSGARALEIARLAKGARAPRGG